MSEREMVQAMEETNFRQREWPVQSSSGGQGRSDKPEAQEAVRLERERGGMGMRWGWDVSRTALWSHRGQVLF